MIKFQENLQKRQQDLKVQKAQLEETSTELLILQKTEKILKKRLKKSLEFVKEFEKTHGLFGLISMESQIEDLTLKKGNLDQLKGKTLEEISNVVEQLQSKIEQKRDLLQPMVVTHKDLKTKMSDLKDQLSEAQRLYDQEVGPILKQMKEFDGTSRKDFEEFQEKEIKLSILEEQLKVSELTLQQISKDSSQYQQSKQSAIAQKLSQ